jgi:hypothetical protein
LDSRGALRARIKYCMRAEAQHLAELLFADKEIRVVLWPDLAADQRRVWVDRKVPSLTMEACCKLLNLAEPPIDHERREREKAVAA